MYNRKFYEEDKIKLTSYLELPSHYVSRDGRIIRTCKLREEKFNKLQKGIIESPYEEEFYSRYPHFDREIILFIENREYWEFLLKVTGITSKEIWNKNYFSLDFFDPYVSLDVEIDSIQHHQDKDLDFVRDQYLKEIFGIRVIRLYGVVLSQNCWMIDDYYKRDDLEPINPELFRFKKISGECFNREHKLDFKLLDILIKLPIYSRNFLRRGLIVTQKDVKELDVPEKSITKLKIFLEKYYEQPLSIIKNSSLYTAKEAFNVISQNSPLGPNDLWSQELLNVYEGKNTAGRFGTREFIEEFNKYGYTWEIVVNSIT